MIEKKTKKSVKEVDIKSHILAWDFSMDAFAKKMVKTMEHFTVIMRETRCLCG